MSRKNLKTEIHTEKEKHYQNPLEYFKIILNSKCIECIGVKLLHQADRTELKEIMDSQHEFPVCIDIWLAKLSPEKVFAPNKCIL